MEHQRLCRLKAMHAKSEYASKPLIVVGISPNRVLYVAHRIVLEFSDDGGLTWVTLPGTENGIELDEVQRATLYDQDYPIQFRRCYRTYGLGELAETSPALLHTEPTNYTVIELLYEVLDVPSLHPLGVVLAAHSVTLSGFDCSISGRSLVAAPRQEFSDMRVARRQFEKVAERWILEAETLGGHAFALQFRGAKCKGSLSGVLWQIIPTPRSEQHSVQMPTQSVEYLFRPTDTEVNITDFLRKVRERIRRGLLNREPIASLAYWEREVLESYFGGAEKASYKLNVSRKLWTEIGRLAALHDWREGRKITEDLTGSYLTYAEIMFLVVACRLLLHRLAIAETGRRPVSSLTQNMVRELVEREIAT